MRLGLLALLVFFLVAAPSRAAELRGVVLLNELEGSPVPNVSVTADGAQPQVSDSNGCFDLDFGSERTPGDVVEIRVSPKEDDYVVIHSILLQHTLLKDANGLRAKIIIARKGYREEMARRFFRLKGDKAAENSFRKQVGDLERRHQADAAGIARLQQELAQAKSAGAKASEELARDSGEKTSPLYQQALKQFLDGKLDGALETLDEAKLQKRKENAREMAREVSREYRLKGQLLTLKFRFFEARAAYQSAAVETAPDDMEAHFAMGYFSQSLNWQKEALTAYGRALELARDEGNLPYVAGTLNNLGNLHRHENRMADARKAYEEALKSYRQLAEKNPDTYLPDVAGTLNNLGDLHSDENRTAGARKSFEEALQIYQRSAKAAPDRFNRDVQRVQRLLDGLKE